MAGPGETLGESVDTPSRTGLDVSSWLVPCDGDVGVVVWVAGGGLLVGGDMAGVPKDSSPDKIEIAKSRPVREGVSTDSLKFHAGLPCPTRIHPVGGPPPKRPYGRLGGGLRPSSSPLDTPSRTGLVVIQI